MSSRIDELDAIVRQFDLNAHPFYVAWRAGELPIERLREYADRVGAVHRRAGSRLGEHRRARLRGRGARARRAVGSLPRLPRLNRRDDAAPRARRSSRSASMHSPRSPRRSARCTASRSSSPRPRRASWPGCASITPAPSTRPGRPTSWSTPSRPMSRRCWPRKIEELSDGDFARAPHRVRRLQRRRVGRPGRGLLHRLSRAVADDRPAPGGASSRPPGRRTRLAAGRIRRAEVGIGRPAVSRSTASRPARSASWAVAADVPGSPRASRSSPWRTVTATSRHGVGPGDLDRVIRVPREAGGTGTGVPELPVGRQRPWRLVRPAGSREAASARTGRVTGRP